MAREIPYGSDPCVNEGIKIPCASDPCVNEKNIEYVDAEIIEFPASAEMDCTYNSFLCASDGTVYLGTCRQNGSAHLLAYDPRQGKILDLANMDNIISDFSNGYARHGKIHTPLFEGSDGKIYGATHMDISFPFWNSYYDSHGYAGGHWFCYDPKSRQCDDLGLAIPKEGVLTTAMDKQRQIIYGVSWPRGYLLSYDIKKRITRNLGRASIHLSRFILCMSDGTVYFPGRNGNIAAYHPDKKFIEDIPVQLKARKNGLISPGCNAEDIVFTTPVEGEPNRSFFAFVFEGDLFKYDCVKRTVEYYPLFSRGVYINVQMIVGPDRKFYYAMPANAGAFSPSQQGRILRFDPQTGKNELVGYVHAKGYPQISHMGGGVIGPDGTMYWSALTALDSKHDITFEEFYGGSGGFRITKPIFIIYKPKKGIK